MATFKATCLTPVHVGNGETMNLLDYKLQDGILYLLDLSRFILDLPDYKKAEFEELTDNSNIKGLRQFIAEHCDVVNYGNRSIKASQEFIEKYKTKFDNLRNQLEVTSFIHSEQSVKTYMPGSSIKGAIRTALVSKLAPEGVMKYKETLSRLEDAFKREINPKFKERKKRDLEKEKKKYRNDFAGVALECNIQNDPFRVVKVADAEMPDGSTIIEKVKNCVVDSEGQLKNNLASMWYEVTGSKLTENPVELKVEIEVDELAQKIGGKHLSKRFGIRDIITACNHFYQNRLTWEHEKFYERDKKAGPLTERLLDERFGKNSFLLRVGRFSHFESLSADGFREGYNPQKKIKITEGSTRNLCRGYIPLGWVKLEKINCFY